MTYPVSRVSKEEKEEDIKLPLNFLMRTLSRQTVTLYSFSLHYQSAPTNSEENELHAQLK